MSALSRHVLPDPADAIAERIASEIWHLARTADNGRLFIGGDIAFPLPAHSNPPAEDEYLLWKCRFATAAAIKRAILEDRKARNAK